MNKVDFGVWVRTEREKRDWTQADLARESGLYRSLINNIENGKSDSAPKTLKALAHAFKYPLELLLEHVNILPPKTDLTPNKRELMEKLKTADDATVKMVIEILEVAVRNKQREIPNNINPKTTPR